LYGAEISTSLVSKATNAVITKVIEWQFRPLDPVYPIVYLDCIVHMVRNSMKFVPWKDYKVISKGLKQIYQSPAEKSALLSFKEFSDRWDDKYPQISRS
jgi:transposase-like protein